MWIWAAAVLAATVATGCANAQSVMLKGPLGAPQQPVRITSAFRTTVALTPTQTTPDIEAQEAARRTLYRMAEGECAILSEMFQMECRLTSMQMFAPAVERAAAWNVMSATGVYELRPRRADP
jgi:hypothetical protein